MTPRAVRIALLAAALGLALPAAAHDPSAWGGIFRSRDHGARWLPVSEGKFIGGALGLAVSPTDPHHLLLATDAGLLRSRNGGRDWQAESPALLFGSVFAAAFAEDGTRALASTGAGLFTSDDGVAWRRAALAREALPARAIVAGPGGRAYVAGASGLWRTDDWGESWTADADGLPDGPVSHPVIAAGPPETVWLVAGSRVYKRVAGAPWASSDAGLPEGRVDALTPDTAGAARLWAAAADQLFRSDDGGRSWAPAGGPLPEPGTSVRGIAVAPDLSSIVLTTHRGLYRSADGGKTWQLQEDPLPIHLEAGPLRRDPADPLTLYAGFALTPYDEAWRMAAQGGTMLGRVGALGLAGGAAFLAVIALAAVAALRWLGRYYGRRELPAPERAR